AEGDDLLARRDLSAQRRLLHGCRGQVRAQRQVRHLELKALSSGEALQRLDLPPIAAEHVRGEAEGALRGEQAEVQLARAQRWRQGRRSLLTARREATGDRREERASLREQEGAGLPQRSLGGDEGGVSDERLIDQRVQRRRFENRPPPLGELLVVDEALRLTTRDLRRCRLRRERRTRIVEELRRSRPSKIRAHGAAANQYRHAGGRRP